MKDSGLEPIIPPNESFDPGSLRRAEAGAISTQGDYGSQGATGEGLFGTSGSGGSSMTSGGYGSKITHESDSYSTPGYRAVASDSEIRSFSCFCGKPMRRPSSASKRLLPEQLRLRCETPVPCWSDGYQIH
jgi:hypothetical protein